MSNFVLCTYFYIAKRDYHPILVIFLYKIEYFQDLYTRRQKNSSCFLFSEIFLLFNKFFDLNCSAIRGFIGRKYTKNSFTQFSCNSRSFSVRFYTIQFKIITFRHLFSTIFVGFSLNFASNHGLFCSLEFIKL